MPDEQDIKIALLERELENLRYQNKEHKIEITTTIEKFSNTFMDALSDVREDLKEIFEFINRSKGSLTTLVFAATCSGGMLAAIITSVLTHYWH